MTTRDAQPPLLTLQRRIDDRVLADAIAAIADGQVPGWRVVQDATDTRQAMSTWRQWISTIGTLIAASSTSGSPTPTPIRTIVLEHQPHRRTETKQYSSRISGTITARPSGHACCNTHRRRAPRYTAGAATRHRRCARASPPRPGPRGPVAPPARRPVAPHPPCRHEHAPPRFPLHMFAVDGGTIVVRELPLTRPSHA